MPIDVELERQYRVARQTQAMHTMLRDRYGGLATAIDIGLLASSVVLCATAFAREDLFVKIGLSPADTRNLRGIFSVLAFFLSLTAIRVNWKGKSANHHEAARKLTGLVALFRNLRRADGTWPPERAEEIQRAYWETMDNIVPIPGRPFVPLKVRY